MLIISFYLKNLNNVKGDLCGCNRMKCQAEAEVIQLVCLCLFVTSAFGDHSVRNEQLNTSSILS